RFHAALAEPDSPVLGAIIVVLHVVLVFGFLRPLSKGATRLGLMLAAWHAIARVSGLLSPFLSLSTCPDRVVILPTIVILLRVGLTPATVAAADRKGAGRPLVSVAAKLSSSDAAHLKDFCLAIISLYIFELIEALALGALLPHAGDSLLIIFFSHCRPPRLLSHRHARSGHNISDTNVEDRLCHRVPLGAPSPEYSGQLPSLSGPQLRPRVSSAHKAN